MSLLDRAYIGIVVALPFRFENFKNGGIRFVRIGRLFFSFGLSRAVKIN